MKVNSYPFTIKDDEENFLKNYRKNYEKCSYIEKSNNKKKTNGQVVNIFIPEFLDKDNKVIVITVEYKTLDNRSKVGECYVNYPCIHPQLFDDVEIYYLDNNYDFIFIDNIDYLDNAICIDSKEKFEQVAKSFRPVILCTILCTTLSLSAIILFNKYLILLSTIVHFILMFANCKTTKESIIYIHLLPYILNLFNIIFYLINNISNIDLFSAVTLALHLIFIITILITKNEF